MKNRKQWVKYVVLGLMVVLLGTTAACQMRAAAEEKILDSYTVEMGENAYMQMTETASLRTAEYYVDGELTQRSVYEFATGEITCWVWDMETEEETVTKYHIDDFLVTEEVLDAYTVEIAEDAYIEVEETASERTAEYFEDEKMLYRAVLSLETGNISDYIYGLSEKFRANELRQRMSELLVTEE